MTYPRVNNLLLTRQGKIKVTIRLLHSGYVVGGTYKAPLVVPLTNSANSNNMMVSKTPKIYFRSERQHKQNESSLSFKAQGLRKLVLRHQSHGCISNSNHVKTT